MLRWCAFCQRFQGEKPPFDSFEVTHGICPSCAKHKNAHLQAEEKKFIQRVANLQRLLWEAGTIGDLKAASDLVDEAHDMNLNPADVLVGLLQPMLYEVGRLWSVNAISVAEEHRFTALADAFILFIRDRYTSLQPLLATNKPDCLLVAAEGNFHSLGLRIVELRLAQMGVPSLSIFPGLPADEVVELSLKLQPKVVGVSISMAEQIPFTIELADKIRQAIPSDHPKVIVGGIAVKTSDVPLGTHATFLKGPDDLLEFFKPYAKAG